MAEIFDRAGAMERVDGDLTLLRDLVKLCHEQCDSRMMVLVHDVRHKDLPAVKRHAHLLKGSLGNIGAVAAHEAAVAADAAEDGARGTGPKMAAALPANAKARRVCVCLCACVCFVCACACARACVRVYVCIRV